MATTVVVTRPLQLCQLIKRQSQLFLMPMLPPPVHLACGPKHQLVKSCQRLGYSLPNAVCSVDLSKEGLKPVHLNFRVNVKHQQVMITSGRQL